MTIERAEESFTERVYALVRRVPRGRVVSYGGIAALLGQPRAARGVGRALNALPDDSDVPWWRVVNRNGAISIRGVLHGAVRQRELLRAERVRFDTHGRIDWRRYGWQPEGEAEVEDGESMTLQRDVASEARRAGGRR